MDVLSRRRALREERYQDELLDRHCAEVENMYGQVRAWRHDYKNQLRALAAYADTGDLAALRRYIAELNHGLEKADTIIKTGSVMADAILNSKLSLAAARGIEVNAAGTAPKSFKTVRESDVCAVLGNLLDNACEACARGQREGEKPFIRVYLDIMGGQFYIYVSNSAFVPPRKIAGKFVSLKPGAHGFGLGRIDRVVAETGGYINRQYEDGVFATEIMLPI